MEAKLSILTKQYDENKKIIKLDNENLREAKYSYDKRYDEFVYSLRAIDTYRVDNNFPRIRRSSIPNAIAKASFDLNIAQIIPFKK